MSATAEQVWVGQKWELHARPKRGNARRIRLLSKMGTVDHGTVWLGRVVAGPGAHLRIEINVPESDLLRDWRRV